MNRLFSLLIKFGILGGIVYAAVATNPPAGRHKTEIAAKVAAAEQNDVLGQADRMMFGDLPTEEGDTPLTYHNYFVASKVTTPEGETASFGMLTRVFVIQTDL